MEPQTQNQQDSQQNDMGMGQQSAGSAMPPVEAPQPSGANVQPQQQAGMPLTGTQPPANMTQATQESPIQESATPNPAPSMAQLSGQVLMQQQAVPNSAPAVPMPATAEPGMSGATPDQAQATPVQPSEIESAKQASASALPEQRAQNGSTKILVVEDEVDARTMFVDLLSSEGYEVSSAVDGVDALAKAAADKYNLILLDIVMPNKDGIEVLQEIKANPDKYGEPVVVMLTNISGDAAIEKAMELGAAGFRLKVDTEPTQLLADVKDFLAGKVQNVEQEPVSRTIT